MLRKFSKLCYDQKTNRIFKICISTEVNEKWDLLTSVCLERKPIVTPLLNSIESDFQKYLLQLELERSLKSDHEIRHENDKKKVAMMKNKDAGELDLDPAQIQTAQDFKDACNEEFSKFQFASRTTEADKKNDFKSLQRKLDRHLVLLTQQEIGKNKYFLPPQGQRLDGETLKQTAERVIKESCGNEMKVKVYGNAPVGFYKYKYPKEVQKQGFVGAKVFIYFARYLDGQISEKNHFKWLDRLELSKEVPSDYHHSLTKFLIEENCTENLISS